MKTYLVVSFAAGLLLLILQSLSQFVPDLSGERPQEKLPLEGFVGETNGLLFSHDGQTLISGGADGTVRLWDVAHSKNTAICKHPVPPGDFRAYVSAVAISPDGKTMASCADGTLRLWDVTRGVNTDSLPNAGTSENLVFSPDGKALVAPGGRRIIWNLETKKERRFLEKATLWHPVVAFTPAGKLLVASADVGTEIRDALTFSLWDADSGMKSITFKGHTANVSLLTFSPDTKGMASAGSDLTVRLWDTETGRNTSTFKDLPGHPFGLAYSRDGKVLACGYLYQGRDGLKPRRGAVRLYETARGNILATLKGSDPGPISPLAFSPDGRFLAAGSFDCIKLWHLPRRYAPE